jgi:hypothetical protein
MQQRPSYLLFAIFITSLSGLALEVGLTRLFSVLFFPPAVFGILSLAILGIGLGAALVTWQAQWQNPRYVSRYLGTAALSVAAIVVAATIPALQPALYGLVILPYLFSGAALTALFSARPKDSPQFYLADLVGAGLGAVLAIPLMIWPGGLNAVLSTGVLLALGGVLISRQYSVTSEQYSASSGQYRGFAGVIFGGMVVLLASNLIFAWLTIDMSRLPSEKPIDSALDGAGEIIETRWDAFARSDLVAPADGSPYRIYMDGAAGSIMPPADGADFLWDDIGLFPFATEQPQRVFLIGPGAGLDVWFALQSNAQEIVGVEVNPDSIALAKSYADYNGDIYGQPNVKILIDDGRSVLLRDETRYDLIFLSQLVTLAAERSGYALVENSSYTVEAFTDYLEHLTPEGQIGIKVYDEPTLTRALATALAALRAQGLTDQEGLQHIIALLDSSAQPPIPLLIIGKQAFTEEDSLSLGAVAQQVGFVPLFLPGVVARPPLDRVSRGEISFLEITTDSENDLSPTTDDRPFFYQFERGIPQALRPLLWGALVVVLFSILLIVIYQRRAAAGGGMDSDHGSTPEPRHGLKAQLAAAPLYFGGLGLGFILVEIGVIQQTRLFLGHPTTAITLALATLLISGGIGSGLAGRYYNAHGQVEEDDSPGQVQTAYTIPVGPLVAVILFIALWLLVWPLLQNQFMGARPFFRIGVVIAALLPLGLAMGMPFPLGLRAAAGWGRGQVPLAWSVNGVMSVVGSISAVTLALLLGYTSVLLAGGAAYALAGIVVILLHRAAGRIEFSGR